MIRRLSDKELIFVKNLFLTTVLGAIIGILNYLFNIFVARYTTSEIFGFYSSVLGIIYLLQIPAVAIQANITKEVALNKKKDLNTYKWHSLLIFSVLGFILSIIFFLCKDIVIRVASIPDGTVLYLSLTLLFAFVSPVTKGLLLGVERVVFVNIILLIETILRFVIGIVAIQNGGSLPLFILASSIPGMLSTLLILPFIRFENNNKEKVSIHFKELLLISLSFLLLTAPFTIDLILVNPVFRAEYSAISLLGKLVYFASITTASVMFARLTNEQEEKSQKKSLLIALGLSLSIGIFISILFFAFSEYIINLTVGSEYINISGYLGVFGVGMAGFAFVYMVANFFISKSYFKYLYILLFTTLLQLALFVFRNESLDMVIQNQIVVFGLLFILTLGYLLTKLNTLRNGREKEIRKKS
jgi:O-antigen/teichoic acid export membrane protein